MRGGQDAGTGNERDGHGAAAFRRAGLVVNAGSRTGEKAFPTALGLLREQGIVPQPAYSLREPARLPETVSEVIREGCDLVILGGGDGTVSSVVDVLAGRDVALGLLPLGTANDFARTLEIPSGLRQACAVIAGGKAVDVDLGLAGENYYVNVASMGLSAGVSRALTPRLKKWAGSLAYPLAALKALRAHEPFSARLSFPGGDHEPVELDGLLQLAVGSGRFYGGGMVVASGASIDDRALDVYAIELGRRRDLLGVASRIRSGDFADCRGVRYFRAPEILIETVPDVAVNLDGEVEARTPKQFSVAANALRVIVPPESAAARDDAAPGRLPEI